jgi:tagatose 1,6-diphosphate aldolase
MGAITGVVCPLCFLSECMKKDRLTKLSNSSGVIAAMAIDQRGSLRRLIADAAGVAPEAISDSQLSEFKTTVARALAPHASAVLLDPEYGLEATKALNGSGLLLAYEMDGFENPRPNKMLALLPELSVRRLRDLGADGIKILLTYTPFDDPRANAQKCALIERIGNECEAVGLPFFLEPVGYDPSGLDVKSFEYAKKKPDIVIRSMEEFSKDVYHVDVLKVEFPVNTAFVEGTPVYCGQAAYTRAEALEIFRRADSAARRPYIYLSAGVSLAQFAESLNLATEAGARYSGVLCGRSTWQDGAKAYATGGLPAVEKWLAVDGVRNIQAVNDCVKSASPWYAIS